MNRTPSITSKVSYPNPTIKLVFENCENDKYNNVSLYQNILEYASSSSSGFRFTQLGRWLMKNYREFINDYSSGSDSNKSISARIANKRQRIQNCIDNLKKWDFLLISKMVPAETNGLETPLYLLTPLGKLFYLTVKADTFK